MKKTRQLVASLVAIVICFAMLIGTTYAWFTDSIVNTNNIIKSGNVDVELYHTNKVKTDEEVTSSTKLFVNTANDPILWEPGASTTETFEVKNVGSLALKYEFRVKALSKTATADGKTLTDVLTINDVAFGNGYEIKDVDLLPTESATYTITIAWPKTPINQEVNNNDYNVEGGLKLLLGVELVATQFASEYDGTSNEYDSEAQFPNATNMADLTNDVSEDVTLATAGENAVEVSLPVALANQLSADKISLVHTEPKVEGDKVIFDAIELIDDNGNTIDLSANDVEFTVTLPAQETFKVGEQVSIYHDGESVATATVASDTTITYTVKHLCEVTVGPWDGTADTDWYNDTDTEFELTSAGQFAGLAELIDGGNTFEGKTIKLSSDINLSAKDENGNIICFDPIGSYRNDQAFKGTFDGQGHTISNLSQNTWALNNGYYYGDLGLGLFGLVEDATIKNLVMDSADISGESAICGTVAACAYGDCTFENITVKNSNVADYQYYAGGIVGWASGNHQYINCNIDASTNIAAQWGDFDNSIGGVIGGAGGSAQILLKDCTVACRIDSYNDVTSAYQWYAYRRAGMLIGNPGKTEVVNGTTYAVAPQLTCENVTVIYGDWANYTYCEFAGTGYPYVRVQAGVSNSAYSNPRYGHPKDANGNEVVDDNHVHNEGEDHHILCQFDQLYGGGQGVYGTDSHEGVTVVYNNK